MPLFVLACANKAFNVMDVSAARTEPQKTEVRS
jgi:hypothetical protein